MKMKRILLISICYFGPLLSSASSAGYRRLQFLGIIACGAVVNAGNTVLTRYEIYAQNTALKNKKMEEIQHIKSKQFEPAWHKTKSWLAIKDPVIKNAFLGADQPEYNFMKFLEHFKKLDDKIKVLNGEKW